MTFPGPAPQGLNQALLTAARARRVDAVEQALNAGADVNATDTFGISAMHIAAAGDDLRMIRVLTDRGAEIGRSRGVGSSPFECAVIGGKIAAMRALSAYVVDLEATEPGARGLLETALVAGQRDTAQWLIDHGADIEALDDMGDTLLARMARGCRVEAVQILLAAGAKVDAHVMRAAIEGNSLPIVIALKAATAFAIDDATTSRARGGGDAGWVSPPSTRFDIESGSKSWWQRLRGGITSAWTSCASDLFLSRQRLIRRLRDWSRPREERQRLEATARLMAALHAHDFEHAMAEIELAHADFEARDRDGMTPLLLATQAAARLRRSSSKQAEGLPEQMLREAAVRVVVALANVISCATARVAATGNTALHEAIVLGDGELAMRMLCAPSVKAAVNLSNRALNRPLHLATEQRDAALIEALITSGADVNSVNRQGHAPLHLSAFLLDYAGAEMLLSKGANFNLRTREGLSVSDILDKRSDQASHLKSLIQTRQAIDSAKSIFSSGNPLAQIVRSRKGGQSLS